MKVGFLFALGLIAASPALAECRDDPIETFFPEFAASIAVQETTVGDMVLVGLMNPDAQPEPQLETILLPKSELLYPLVPNLTVFLQNGGTVAYTQVDAEESRVTLWGDNGYLVSLGFFGPCWEVRSIFDESL